MTTIVPLPTSEHVWIPARSERLAAPDEVGGKGFNLARLTALGCRVPPFFVLGTPAFAAVVGDGRLPASDAEAERRRDAVLAAEPGEDVATALRLGLESLGAGDGLLAVRSSAVGEDGGEASFAGQFETVLGVPATEAAVWDAVRQVWASAFTPHALRYLRGQGAATARVAVVVQRLVQPQVSGVAFSVDPVTGSRDVAVVSAVYGLGEGLVSGALDADTYRVRFPRGRPAAVDAQLAAKEQAVRAGAGGGTAMVAVDRAASRAAALADGEAVRIAEAARSLAGELGAPQDVEWALADGEDGPRTLYVLQTRPVTATGAAATKALPGDRRVWDNENIVEPFPGITLPLNFSIGGHMMGQVFKAYAEATGAPAATVEANAAAFRDLLGLVRGRVYYNLRNYNRVVSMVPGIRIQGDEVTRVPLPAEPADAPPIAPGALPAALLLAARVLPIPPRLLRDTARLPAELADFTRRAAETLEPLAHEDFANATVDEIRAAYARIDQGLLRHWHAPMLSDGLLDLWLLAMHQTVNAWMPDAPQTLVNDLIAGDGGMVSTEPLHRLAEIAAAARDDEAARTLLAGDADDAEVWRRLAHDAAFARLRAEMDAYLRAYGDRCADEMKMEARTYADDPTLLVAALRAQVRLPGGAKPGARAAEMRAAAEAEVRERLPAGRQVPFFAVLQQVRRLMRDRENTRFERTRALGILRRAFHALGSRLAEGGALGDAGDVHYLTHGELFAYLDGTAPGALRPLAEARKAEFAAYAAMPELPPRFVTVGPPALSAIEPYRTAGGGFRPAQTGDTLRGMGCCAGLVRAPVRIVHDPREAGSLDGRILVARQTDPGWTLLFAGAAGVLVQRGSLLSHAAIVAREMGIPCIVAIPDLFDRLTDGELVVMDGAAGTVRVGMGPAD